MVSGIGFLPVLHQATTRGSAENIVESVMKMFMSHVCNMKYQVLVMKDRIMSEQFWKYVLKEVTIMLSDYIPNRFQFGFPKCQSGQGCGCSLNI